MPVPLAFAIRPSLRVVSVAVSAHGAEQRARTVRVRRALTLPRQPETSIRSGARGRRRPGARPERWPRAAAAGPQSGSLPAGHDERPRRRGARREVGAAAATWMPSASSHASASPSGDHVGSLTVAVEAGHHAAQRRRAAPAS